jgi:excinuclease UvrABC nuclease subunit
VKVIAAGRLPGALADQWLERQYAEKPGTVYRIYPAPEAPNADVVQYIGKSVSFLHRLAQHDDDAREFLKTDFVVRQDQFDTEKEALAAEKRMIESMRPVFNIKHNQRNPNRKRDRKYALR